MILKNITSESILSITSTIMLVFYVYVLLIKINPIVVDGATTTTTDPLNEFKEQSYRYSRDPDADRNTSELIRSRGFQAEEYNVTTDDGYIINVNRIVGHDHYNDNEKITCRRKPIILGHGLFLSADAYLLNTPQLLNNESIYGNNLGFSLALTGRYDVWLFSARGTDYSQNHQNKTFLKQGKYWRFSFDQISQFDLTAVIRHVQQRTGCQKDIGYIGHSQGTSIMFALLSSKPYYSNIISPFIALAPVVYTEHTVSPYRYLAPLMPILRLRGGQFLITTKLLNRLWINGTCHVVSTFCWYGLTIRLGFDQKSLNNTRKELYARWYGASDWNVAQWSQIYQTGRFARFDYGSKKLNQLYYGQDNNPEYNLTKISKHTKIAIYQSQNDYLSTLKDGQRLKTLLRENGIDLIDDYILPDPKFNHLDFMYGHNTGQQYIDRLIFLLDQHNIYLNK